MTARLAAAILAVTLLSGCMAQTPLGPIGVIIGDPTGNPAYENASVHLAPSFALPSYGYGYSYLAPRGIKSTTVIKSPYGKTVIKSHTRYR